MLDTLADVIASDALVESVRPFVDVLVIQFFRRVAEEHNQILKVALALREGLQERQVFRGNEPQVLPLQPQWSAPLENLLAKWAGGVKNVEEGSAACGSRAENPKSLELGGHCWNLEPTRFQLSLHIATTLVGQVSIKIDVPSRTEASPKR